MKKLLNLFAALIIPAGSPDIEISNFNLVESLGSKRSMELTAKTAKIYQNEQLSLLSSLRSKVWSTKGSLYNIKAKSSVLDSSTQDFRTDGQTSISTPDAYLFETQNIHYFAAKKLMTGEDKVVLSPIKKLSIAGQQFFLKGTGLELNLETDKLRILENVTANQESSLDKKLNIKSQSFEFDTVTSNGNFVGKVKVDHPDYTMRGDSLELSFSAKGKNKQSSLQEMFLKKNRNGKINAKIGSTTFRSKGFKVTFKDDGELLNSEAIGSAEATLEGGISLKAEKLYSFTENGESKLRMEENVEITTTERIAKCGRAIFTPKSGQFILYDVTSLSDGKQSIKGKEIIFSTKDSYLKVKQASGNLQKSSID